MHTVDRGQTEMTYMHLQQYDICFAPSFSYTSVLLILYTDVTYLLCSPCILKTIGQQEPGIIVNFKRTQLILISECWKVSQRDVYTPNSKWARRNASVNPVLSGDLCFVIDTSYVDILHQKLSRNKVKAVTKIGFCNTLPVHFVRGISAKLIHGRNRLTF